MPLSATSADVLSFPAGDSLDVRLERSFSLIAFWTAALADRTDFHLVTQRLCSQVQAANICLYRAALSDMKPRLISSAGAGQARPERPCAELARFLIGRHADSLLPGTVWRLSDLSEDPRFPGSALERAWSQRSHHSVSVVVLGRGDGQVDLMEMVFAARPSVHPSLSPAKVIAAMADAWQGRSAGIINRLIAEAAHSRAPGGRGADADHAILGPMNAYGLSRAELRVCQLLGSGLKPGDIGAQLDVSIATVRTHLRNIYAKTGCSGQVEVMARLRAPASHDAPDAAAPRHRAG